MVSWHPVLYINELICEWMASFNVSNTFELSGMQGSVEHQLHSTDCSFIYYEAPTKLVTSKE